jgi:hypothetical protein
MNWTEEGDSVQIEGRECQITIEARPSYCDRGNYIAKLHPTGDLARQIDKHAGWPRYYFELDRAKLECEEWLINRRQALQPRTPDSEILHGLAVFRIECLMNEERETPECEELELLVKLVEFYERDMISAEQR